MLRRVVRLSFALFVWLAACAERQGEDVSGAAPTQRPTQTTSHEAQPADASVTDRSLDAHLADASQTSSELADAQAEAGVGRVAGYPFLGRYLINARDLGGIRLPGPARVAFDRLFRGPLLATLRDSGCSAFASAGIHTIVDLRMPSEMATNPDPVCVADNTETVLAPLPVPVSASAEEYIAMLDVRDSISRFFAVVADPSAYPIYFHCTVGRDRTGVAAALLLLALGAAREDILQDYLRSRQTGGVAAEPLDATLDEIQRRGGIEAYLSLLGVSAEHLRALRQMTIEPLP